MSRFEMENCCETRLLIYRCDHTKNHSLIQEPKEAIFPSILSQKSGHPRREKCVIFSSLNQLISRVFNKYPYIGGNSKTQTLDGIFKFHPKERRKIQKSLALWGFSDFNPRVKGKFENPI